MSQKNQQKTNLNFAIEVQLGIQDKPKICQISNDEKMKYEEKFQEFYENSLETGFYIHRDQNCNDEEEIEEKDADQNDIQPEQELVQFYNYNLNKGWWHIDEKNKKIIFFDKNGTIISKENEYNMTVFFELTQQQNMTTLLNNFYEKYDYVLAVIYNKIKNNFEDLTQIYSKIQKSSKSQVSEYLIHKKLVYEDQQQQDGQTVEGDKKVQSVKKVEKYQDVEEFKRICIFISKYDFIDDEELKKKKEYTFNDFKQLLNDYSNKGVLIFPLIVKEEIKDFIKSDFCEQVSEKIFSYCQQHRYECLYDSDSEDEEQEHQEPEESSDEDEEDDNNAINDSSDEDEEDDNNVINDSSDDEQDKPCEQIYVQKA
ncbi:hypothetical protein ABPG72_006021 [Tetrahymena utriculariae]